MPEQSSLEAHVPKSARDNEQIGDLAEKDHNRIEPQDGENYYLYSFKAYDDNQETPIYESGSEINSAKYVVPNKSILISKLNPRINRVWRVKTSEDNAICSTEFVVLRPKNGIPLDYLFAVLNEPTFRDHLVSLTTGTSGSHQRVKQSDILEYEVPNFSDYEKAIIGHIYALFDDKISVNVKIGQNLINICNTLFRSWFIDFDPYQEFRNSELGEIPKNFEIVNFSDICHTEGGGTPDTDNEAFWGGDILWLTPKELASLSSPIAFDTERKLTKEGLENTAAKVMPKNSTLLYSRGANMGSSVINKEPMATNQGFVCVEPKKVPPHFMFHLVSANRRKIENMAGGSTYPEISQTAFNDIEVAIPNSLDMVKEFEGRVEPLYEDVYNRMVENCKLREVRDILLPKLISGELSVNDIKLDGLYIKTEV